VVRPPSIKRQIPGWGIAGTVTELRFGTQPVAGYTLRNKMEAMAIRTHPHSQQVTSFTWALVPGEFGSSNGEMMHVAFMFLSHLAWNVPGMNLSPNGVLVGCHASPSVPKSSGLSDQ